MAPSFCSIEKIDIPICQLTDAPEGFPIEGEVTIIFDLKNIRVPTISRIESTEDDASAVHLEVLDHGTIAEWLRTSRVGIAAPSRKLYSDVCRSSFAGLWLQSMPNSRYWLCHRSEDRNIIVERCLNGIRALEPFGGFVDDTDGDPWITLFREDEHSDECFDLIYEDSMLIFCKLWKTETRDLTYLGHLLVQRTNSCRDLLQKMVTMSNCISSQDLDSCGVYLEKGGSEITELIDMQSTLEECGLESGSIVILRWPKGEGSNSEVHFHQLPNL